MEIKTTWSEVKSRVDNYSLKLQYTEVESTNVGTIYNIWVIEPGTTRWCQIDDVNNSNDVSDFETNYKANANKKIDIPVRLTDGVNDVDIILQDGVSRLATDSVVTVKELLSFDDYADSFFRITNAGSAGDTINVKIDQPAIVDVTSTLTSTEAGDVEKTAQLIMNDLNNDSSFKNNFVAKSLYNMVFIISKNQGEEGEYPEAGDLTITPSGTTTVQVETNFDRIIRRQKQVLGEADSVDNRYVRLGIYGEVGSRTKADHPINVSVRKTLATKGQIVFVDKSVPTNQIWFIGGVAVADEVASEFSVWEGKERDRVESWTADGTLFTHVLDYQCLTHSNYHNITVNGVGGYTEGDDYVIEDYPDDETKSQLRWINTSNTPASGDVVEITYDAVIRRVALFVQAESSQEYYFQAPIKLEPNGFILAIVENKSANAAVVICNISGFYEELIV